MSTRDKLENIKEINDSKAQEYKPNWLPLIFFIAFGIVIAYFIANAV